MSPFSNLVLAAADQLRLPPEQLVPLGGESARAFAVSGHVLRVGPSGTIDVEEAAAAQASAAVPVPRVLARVDHGSGSALLMTRMPGSPAWQPDEFGPGRARRRGLACGRAQLALSTIVAPPQVASARTIGADTGLAAMLLHLDLHPLNILLDEDDNVSAVLDWANASAGPAEYDRARTATILRSDPSTQQLRHDSSWHAFVAGWTEGAHLDEVSAGSIAWACRYMLEDLSGRHPEESLKPIAEALMMADSLSRRPSGTGRPS